MQPRQCPECKQVHICDTPMSDEDYAMWEELESW